MIASVVPAAPMNGALKLITEQDASLAQMESSPPSGPLSQAEENELLQHETVVQKGLLVFLEVGNALIQIKEKHLYRNKKPNFCEYCRVIFDFGSAHVYRLIEAAETRSLIGPVEPGQEPTSERQFRPICALKPEHRKSA